MGTEKQFIDWLLAAETPSIRYQTRIDLLGAGPDDPAAAADRKAIMTGGPVPAIFARQTPAGHWENEQSYYTPKYTSSHWSLMVLAELWVDPADGRFQRGVDFMLADTAGRLQQRLAENNLGFSCLWGNIMRYAFHAGRFDDPRAAALVGYAVRDLGNGHCRCEINSGHACAWGVARTFWGLAALPAGRRSPEVESALTDGVEFLLSQHNLTDADYPVPENGKISPYWFRLNFPLYYQADILFTLRVLGELDRLDHPGAQPALDWLEGQRSRQGRWRGRNPFGRRGWGLGDRQETARWVSLQAARILKQAGRLTFSGA